MHIPSTCVCRLRENSRQPIRVNFSFDKNLRQEQISLVLLLVLSNIDPTDPFTLHVVEEEGIQTWTFGFSRYNSRVVALLYEFFSKR